MPEGGIQQPAPKRRLSKRTWIIIIVCFVVIVAGVGAFVFSKKDDTNTNGSNATVNTNSDRLVRRYIDGVMDLKANQNMYPVGVMIENLATIRPQAGLVKANVVYEALVEGGITRFLAVFTLTESIDKIGPVRSARPYYIDWVKELNAMYAHVGGSPQAMSDIQTKGVINLDQFYDPTNFWREKLKRPIEHNMFTSGRLLTLGLAGKDALTEGDFEPWVFKDDAALSERLDMTNPITIDFSSASYQVVYQYDRATNTYNRFQADQPHVDMDTNEQISPKNVLVQYVKTGLADAQRLTMETVGSGDALLFRDGQVIEGSWSKDSVNDRTLFTDASGEPMEFTSGQTWVEVVPDDRTVTY